MIDNLRELDEVAAIVPIHPKEYWLSLGQVGITLPTMFQALSRWWYVRGIRRRLEDLKLKISAAQSPGNQDVRLVMREGITIAGECLRKGEIWSENDAAAFSRLLTLPRDEWNAGARAVAGTLCQKVNLLHQEWALKGEHDTLCFGLGFWTRILSSMLFEELWQEGLVIWAMVCKSSSNECEFSEDGEFNVQYFESMMLLAKLKHEDLLRLTPACYLP